MSEYIMTCKVEDKKSKLMSFCMNDEKLQANIKLFDLKLKILKKLN